MIVLNDLFDYNLKIYQDSEKFKFSIDSILLAEFVNNKKKTGKLLDICTGTSPIPLILANKYNIDITGVELQKDVYNLALKSIKINNLENKIKLLNINAKDLRNYFPGNNFDIITCNPPYFKVTSKSILNHQEAKSLARHELTITLLDIIEISSKLLKSNGEFYLVHRPERLEEIISVATKFNLHVKHIEFIYTKKDEYAIIVLLKFIKCANPSVKIGSKYIDSCQTYQGIFNN